MSADHVLLINQSPALARTYATYLMDAGFHVTHADSIEQIAHRIKQPGIGMAILDPDGLAIDEPLPEFIRHLTNKPVILITERASMSLIIGAMKAGAKDVFIKPFDRQRLIDSARHFYPDTDADTGKQTKSATDTSVANRISTPDFIGSSAIADDLRRQIKTIAGSTAPVFITGESGTGKEVSAKLIHYHSGRIDHPFVPVNCAAIPDNLIESELFGHTKGAFTGAVRGRDGAIRRADGGTLFLDEVLDMPPMVQSKLLRFLEDYHVRPVGGDNEIKVNIRVIAASNKNPKVEINSGHFRRDLFYRLHVIPLHLPPLRDRLSDIPELAQYFLSRLSVTEDHDTPHLTPGALDKLSGHPWYGNIRELKNTLHHAMALVDGPIIPADSIVLMSNRQSNADPAGIRTISGIQPLAVVERIVIEQAIDQCDGNITKAAEMLDISPSTIYRKKENW